MADLPWLTILGVVPLVGALVLMALPSGRDLLVKQVALLTSLVVLAGTIVMSAAFEPDGDRFQFVQAYDWIPAFGVQYAVGVDGIALVLIALIAVLVPVVVLASWYDADPEAEPVAVAATAGAGAESVAAYAGGGGDTAVLDPPVTVAPPADPPRARSVKTFFALLLVLAAIAAVGVALLASGDNGSGVSPVDADDVQQQIQELRQFLQDHSR